MNCCGPGTTEALTSAAGTGACAAVPIGLRRRFGRGRASRPGREDQGPARLLKAENRLVDKDQRSAYDDVASARLVPENTSCRMQLVNVYMRDDRAREALDICEELSRIDPEG